MNLQKVAPGQNLVISASDWNAFIDAAIANRNRGGFNGDPSVVSQPFCKVQSLSQNLKYGQAIVFDRTMATGYMQPTTTETERLSYLNWRTLPVKRCELTDGFDPIGIVQNPADLLEDATWSGTTALWNGVVPVRFNYATPVLSSHTHAYCGDDGCLVPSTVGSHRILTALTTDTDDGANPYADVWGLVQLNTGLRNQLQVEITGSTLTAARRWTYTFKEVYRNGSTTWADVTAGLTHTNWAAALNGLEAYNAAGATVQSSSYNFNAPPLLTQTGYELNPITGNPVVTLTVEINNGVKYATFYAQNIVAGECV